MTNFVQGVVLEPSCCTCARVVEMALGSADAFLISDAWTIRVLPAYKVCGWHHFSKDEDLAISSCSHASRLGTPCGETMLYGFTKGFVSSWGAPMVPVC